MDKEELPVKAYQAINFPRFNKPVIIGYYSTDHEGKFSATGDTLKYLKYDQNKVNFDLNHGFEHYIGKPETMENEEKLSKLLSWLNQEKILHEILNRSQEEYYFISYRGTFTAVMNSLHENRDSWLICATKIKNVIFLCAFYSDTKKAKLQKGMTDREKRLCYGGFKFEQYMLSESPDKEPNTSVPVNSNEEFCLVFQSKLNKKKLIYGAEMDGIKSDIPIKELSPSIFNEQKFIELKTHRFIQNERQERNFKRFSLCKWWCQSFLVGIEEVYCGFRNDEGIVRSVRKYRVNEMPCYLWNASSYMQFLDQFLEFVLQTLKNEPNFTYWRFDWAPSWENVKRKKLPAQSEYKFLPDWLIKECK